MRLSSNQKAFTIVELLLVFVVVGIMATFILNAVQDVSLRARNSQAERTLRDIEQAILRLAIDTSKWPGGCPPETIVNPESDIESNLAGLTQTPPIGIIDADCQWGTGDVAAWQGPYISDPSIIDPWGNSYIFDPDFYPYNSCATIPAQPTIVAVVSYGADGVRYTCDDLFRNLSE